MSARRETQTATRRPMPRWSPEMPMEIDRWLLIEPDNRVTVFTGKVEMGQGIRTSLAQTVADELRIAANDIELVMGDTALTPYDPGTFGSMTTPIMAAHLRTIGASARESLARRAAARWGVSRADVGAGGGQAVHTASGRSLSYWELVGPEGFQETAREDAATTPAPEWVVEGRSMPRSHVHDIVTGAHRYPSDIKRPGMLYGKVLRPPSLRATLLSIFTGEAENVPGARVVRLDDFVGVVAGDEATATRVLSLIRATWCEEPLLGENDLFTYLKTHPAHVEEGEWGGPMCEEHGAVDRAFAGADHVLQRTYTVEYIAHAPLEPRAATAEWDDGRLTVWTGTQRPFGVREELATAFALDEDDVRVIVPDTGSGYGGKHTGEAAREAALLAKLAGAPVHLVWTRQEEFTWAYMRPAGVIEVSSAATDEGKLVAWDFHNYNSGTAGISALYAIPNQRLAFDPSEQVLRQGSYRALAATANHFARETHVDEIAVELGVDPLDFRRRNIADSRLRDVLEAAANRFGWGTRLPAGHGAGIAVGHEKGSYVATCAEVAVDGPERRVRVVRVVQAFECGAIVNPDGLRNQVEGAIVQGLGGALFERVRIADGRIASDGFARYRVPRFSDIPTIEVVLLDRPDLPSTGAGETPIVGIAPAVGNAIFAATGRRLRAMPLTDNGVLPG